MESDNDKIGFALRVWANHIETGDLTISAKDAENIGRTVKKLDANQMRTVIRLKELATLAHLGKITVDEN